MEAILMDLSLSPVAGILLTDKSKIQQGLNSASTSHLSYLCISQSYLSFGLESGTSLCIFRFL